MMVDRGGKFEFQHAELAQRPRDERQRKPEDDARDLCPPLLYSSNQKLDWINEQSRNLSLPPNPFIMVDCKLFSEQRFKCHSVYGKGGEDCLHQELSEKRCLSLHHCSRQAHEYYGDFPMSTNTTELSTTSESGSSSFLINKALCASWAESFAYADRELEFGPEVADHHKQAQQIVSQDRGLKRECRDIAFALAQCLRQKKLF